MTREEAIAFFRDMNECTYGNVEAVEMAIKALEQEPCEDCVSREKALMCLTGLNLPNDTNKLIALFNKRLQELPRFDYEQEPTTKNDKVDCEHTDCNNCVNHKYCDYEPTTKNDLGVDAISRKAVLEITAETGALETQNRVKALPPVTPIRLKGHWISHGEHCRNLEVRPSGLGAYEWCSNCDCGIDVKEWYRSRYNYCPNCGADMRGSENECDN
jgi:hypothetical protein